jgi:hypothetical protein
MNTVPIRIFMFATAFTVAFVLSLAPPASGEGNLGTVQGRILNAASGCT